MTMRSSSLLLSAFLLMPACGGDDAAGTASGGGTETDGTGTTDGSGNTTPGMTTQTTMTTASDSNSSTTGSTTDTTTTNTTNDTSTSNVDSATDTSDDSSTSGDTDSSGQTTVSGSESSGDDSGSTSGVSGTDSGSESGTDSGSESTGGPMDCTSDLDCQDGSYCNGEEQCIGNVCVEGTPVMCSGDDGIACTVHTCSEQQQACVHLPDSTLCPDNQVCDAQDGCITTACVQVPCQGKIYQCGDCTDNDGDGLIDMDDPNCWGPCDNNESGWKGNIPGQQNQSECNTMDCYFDQDGGSGNDQCHWSHTCDPLEPSGCNHNPNYKVPGSGGKGCNDLFNTQSPTCLNVCGPLTPNGCDCFGCCEVYLEGQQDPVTIYLGTEDNKGNGTCGLQSAANPELCHPCTQVAGCLNECEECEICIGKDTLPPHCDEEDQCPNGEQPCGQDGQADCQQGFFCLTGCCQPIPL